MNILTFAPLCSDPDEAVRKFCAKTLKIPYAAELLYLPYVLFRYKIELTPFFGRKKTEESLFLVDRLQGTPMNIQKTTRFELSGELQREFEAFQDLFLPLKNKKTTAVIQRRDVEEDHVLPATLEEDEAIKKGKHLLMYDLMRITGNLRYRRLDITPCPETKIIYYPYWIIYYRNKKEKMEFAVYDGMSGEKEKGQVVESIKLGLFKKQKNKNLSEAEAR
jgi:hypothetical protein